MINNELCSLFPHKLYMLGKTWANAARGELYEKGKVKEIRFKDGLGTKVTQN